MTGALGMVRHLKATRAADSPPDQPEFSGLCTCGCISEKSMVRSEPLTSTVTFTRSGTSGLRPSLSSQVSAL